MISQDGSVTTVQIDDFVDKWFLFMSDEHFDSPHCDRKLLIKHCDQALERDAYICMIGDWFDVMCTYSDNRRSKDLIRDRYNAGNYLDLVVKDSGDFLNKYKENILMMSYGNHERTVRKYNETDILWRLVERLNLHVKKPVLLGGYAGWIKLRFKSDSHEFPSLTVRYHHGAGGGRRSKGVLDADIDGQKWPDADLVIKGHSHHKWFLPLVSTRLTEKGKPKRSTQIHLRLGTYADGLRDEGGFGVERDFQPCRLGGFWVRFYRRGEQVEMEIQEAY